MLTEHFSELIKLLQASIAPVTVISGVGLLLLSMTNRYGRIIDRTRTLVKEVPHLKDPEELMGVEEQIKIFLGRANILRTVIVLASGSIFFVSLTIFSLFITGFFSINIEKVAIASFIFSLALLMGSLGFFIQDIKISLKALRLEARKYAEAAH
jgi:hypothetical protein